jgi:Xaa-Pro aminopeptidase
MLTAEGCQNRQHRFREALAQRGVTGPVLLADPLHLNYLTGFTVDPISLSADYGGLLMLAPDQPACIWHDDKLPASVESAHAQRVVLPWYDFQTPARMPRRLVWQQVADQLGLPIADAPGSALRQVVVETIADLRRSKDPDELALLRRCMAAGEAGHAWARANLRPGMSELEIYAGVSQACTLAAGQPVIVYGDFAVSPGPERIGGPPTPRRLQPGDLFILDFSVVIAGYRGDFTATLCVGGQPSAAQLQQHQLCQQAMAAGEALLRAGQACAAVDAAVRGVFAAAGLADYFPHHSGHGLGLAHPEAPYFVRHASETLRAGDVVTLEPGLYIPGQGGMRIERNYLITPTGYEQLSHHTIALA